MFQCFPSLEIPASVFINISVITDCRVRTELQGDKSH
jgi:hypothetical protein